MADSIDAQTRQENIEQEGVPVTNVVRTSAQTEREVIDLSNDDNTNGGSGRNEGNSTGKEDHHIHGPEVADILQNRSR